MYGQQLFSHGGQEATTHGATSHAKMFGRDVRGALLQFTFNNYYCDV